MSGKETNSERDVPQLSSSATSSSPSSSNPLHVGTLPVDRTSNSSSSDSPVSPPPKRKRFKRRTGTSRSTLTRHKKTMRGDLSDASEFEDDSGNEAVQIDVEHDAAAVQLQTTDRDESHVGIIVNSESDETSSQTSTSTSQVLDEDSSLFSDSWERESVSLSESDVNETHSESNSDSDSEDGFQPLYEGSEMSMMDGLHEVFNTFIEERWTKKSLDKTMKSYKKMLPQPNAMPSSGKAAIKILENLTTTYHELEHSFCTSCFEILENNSYNCDYCGHQQVDKFYSFPIQEQIQHMFEHRDLAAIIDFHREHHKRQDGCICDVQDGIVYKNVKSHLNGPYDLVLLWNTDGVEMSGSSKQELWPLLATIVEIPPLLRASFVLVCGVYVGEKKSLSMMNMFLQPFVSNLKEVYENGVSWKHPTSEIMYCSKIVAPLFTADAPAKALVLQVQQYNAKYGCNTCEQKSKRVALTAEEILENENQINPRKRKKRKRCFLYEEDAASAQLRTGPQMDLQGAQAAESGKSLKGVVGNAVVSQIPLFDRALCVSAEYMHFVLLGVVKHFLHKIFFVKGPWYIGAKLKEIDEFISTIRVPDFVKRLPRGISVMKFWKASEFRNFLLFYSLPLFKVFMGGEYFQHWLLLVSSVYILLQTAISDDDMTAAEIMLKAFVRDIGEMYGHECYTYNVHSLLHTCLLVRRMGPLWATSAFLFESFNGYITAHVHGTKHLGKELINNIKISQNVAMLKNIVNAPQNIFPGAPKELVTAEVLGKPIDRQRLSAAQMATLSRNSQLGSFQIYIRAKMESTVYTCRFYDENKKRSNSFICFQSDGNVSLQHGEIIAFVKSENGSVFCLQEIFKVLHSQLIFHEISRYVITHLLPVEASGNFLLVPIEHITAKVLKVGMYLGISPNPLEVNL